MKNNHIQSTTSAGFFTLALRLVIGWTYFSAFWRRLILANKLNPDIPGYIGEKFNHFLPNALGIKPMIEFLLLHPHLLLISMMLFTIVEATLGLFIMSGLFSRLMSIGVFLLAMGILLGSGWLGTTCLDEWQIGILGMAGGFTLFLTGSDAFSLDHYFIRKGYGFTSKSWFKWLGSGALPMKNPKWFVLGGAVFIFGMTLFTNQYFHGGVWGALHNKSVKPKIEISNVKWHNSELTFDIYRTEGVDVYGSFLIGIEIDNQKNEAVKSLNEHDLAKFPLANIRNYYVAKVVPGKHSLVVPLGAKAEIKIDTGGLSTAQNYTLKLIDISGIEWTAPVNQPITSDITSEN
ncbi:TQO small subunit DoxD [Microbacter margulisiae]|uniref:Thiosulfate dehydrogenase [quinone] large subunit n=1 Tax=Microbacter margulisiae TaxID=1350067 RepID=A0A7W5DP85_9PORP|nr:TQO small subunit DoxD [Microbacter margulisiae]MBB3186569.1 thiosulfate dehydrogenase [quinone] large subunit [Microbacter margulisiae]